MNDIALVKIPQPIKFTRMIETDQLTSNDFIKFGYCKIAAEIQPVCLAPPSEPDHVDDILHVSGWGRHSECKSNIFIFLIQISRLHWNDISLL